MSKISGPMLLATELLAQAYEKAGQNKRIIAEETELDYQTVLTMYHLKKVPPEKHMLKIEKFLSRKKFKPRESVYGPRPH